ncbi:MAG TPA: ABC transporter substrate-binding protein [Candidatus Limnocylindria bacterium]|nr:ABC transporter substrate-binding protein [Candidatus Limnocylindria bacterium]
MRSARAFVVLVTVALVATVCGGSTAAPSPSGTVAAATATPKPTPVKIKSSYGNVTPSNLAPFMAKELGLFDKYNLDVTLDLIDGGVASSAALVSGNVQIGNFGGTEAMSAVAGGGDMQVVALFVPVTPWQLLAKSDFKGPNDLKGKVVGVASIGGSAYIAAVTALQKMGLDPKKDVTIQAFGNTASLTAAMLGGAAYAGPGHPPDTVKLLAGGFKVVYDLAAEKVLATDNCTVVLKSWAEKNPQAVQAYIDAEVEAMSIAKKDKAKTLPILAKLLKLDLAKPDDATAVSQTYDFYVQLIFPLYPHPTVASFNASRDALVAQNPNVKDMDVSKVFDDRYVADAEKRGVGK